MAKDQSDASRPGSRAADALRASGTNGDGDAKARTGEQEGPGKQKSEQAPGDVGRALKTVYDDTLREDVPKDFLDLLGKLS